ncbi:hypothetical protein BDV28DRAFT_164702 [Aspergillus coremiiformis]|uniref:Zn(2)-C6 fungal-type domain-containing protein n=1 Tax=Aspergillus coremiiformis TaxID=138285 RepID=A0A5N6Z9G0_9EURO|nr:hypothetical protein BDV28DRAFT_164702 [Aspergillus coremiiformis]
MIIIPFDETVDLSCQAKMSTAVQNARKRKRVVISCTECHRRKQKCDRSLPCQNCIKQGKMTLCQYEGFEPPGPTLSGSSSGSEDHPEFFVNSGTIEANRPVDLETDTAVDRNVLISDLGYFAHARHSTLGVLEALDTRNSDGAPSSASKDTAVGNLQYELASKYRDLLLEFFFRHVNWGYDVIDEITFRRQLESWMNIPYPVLRCGPCELNPQIRVFPALLLQVGLRYMPGMCFHDVAKEFSEAGAAIIDLLGKRCIVLGTVQSGLLRAAFLKSSGLVVEAWHTLGSAIRDAQELGLHFNEHASDPLLLYSNATEEMAWDQERRSRLWPVLHIWDTHMAVVLGRPIVTRLQGTFALPRDVCGRQDQRLPRERTVADPPTAFSVILAGYATAYQYFPTVHHIAHSGGRQEDYSTVDKVHTAIIENIQSLPPCCRVDKPDSTYDREVSCTWLPAARETLRSLVHFVLLALHRPYIFSAAKSRIRALKAGLEILHAQARLFRLFEPHQPKIFNMVYATLDAIVLVTTIFILYSQENRDYLEDSLQSVEWGLSTLATIGQYNEMARTAHGIGLSLYRRLKKCLASTLTDANGFGTHVLSPGSQSTNAVDNSRSKKRVESHFTDHSITTTSAPHVMRDLFFQNLSGISTPMASLPFTLPDNLNLDLPDDVFQFHGTYPSDSFWSFMNDYTFSTIDDQLL